MALMSMTGFGRHQESLTHLDQTISWTWEARSVNGKALDIKLRMPSGYDCLESSVKSVVKSVCGRGSITLGLNFERVSADLVPRVNANVLEVYVQAARALVEDGDAVVAPATSFLALKGVTEFVEPMQVDVTTQPVMDALIESAQKAMIDLVDSRRVEGAALSETLDHHMAEIAALIDSAQRQDSVRMETRKKRIKALVADFLEAGAPVEEDRLTQELALLAIKADIREEVDRLSAHVVSAKDMLQADGPIGRKLDFLCQEFNREANTLCSKSGDTDLTNIGIELKTVIDRFREQVQNVE